MKTTKFWTRVNQSDNEQCWLYTKSLASNGYAKLRIGGKQVGAHRFAYESKIGPIPIGLCVLHKCDVRNCVNPAHLFLGTNADNMADKVAKGRQARRETHGRAKLTVEEVTAIRGDHRHSDIVATIYGIHRTQVGRIRDGVQWR